MAGRHSIWGATGRRVDFSGDNTSYGSATSPADATATYNITSGGTVTGTDVTNYTWLIKGAGADYEVMASGSGTTTGPIGTWESLGSTQSWTVVRTTSVVGSSVANLTMEVRLAAGGAVIATFNVTLTAEVLAP